jgi:hypothetical protein
MLWGSFGDTNLRSESVRKCYYDDDTWRDLQALPDGVLGNSAGLFARFDGVPA